MTLRFFVCEAIVAPVVKGSNKKNRMVEEYS